ncbi:hypothetical protein ACFRJ9_21670 [Paenarthrobacter sp. NPDC056912]|uniref:hypothetical protein n=1 Tax=Paenarthrobacter sp. NPDC056912 TaxID=3345965 RepID=UPI00366A71B0
MPEQPAAVLIHAVDGTVATLCLDLDTSKAAPAVVRQDAEGLGKLLSGAGLRFVEDFSPSGGRHLYIPLAERMEGSAARDLVEALGTRYRSLDKTPHQNIHHGCVRPPGSRHKSGGQQHFATSRKLTYAVTFVEVFN